MSFLVNSPTLENLVVLSLLLNVALKSSISIALFPIDWKKSVIGLFANNISLDINSPFTLTAISLHYQNQDKNEPQLCFVFQQLLQSLLVQF